jgi:cytochrome d ubiquinol oxidase subunit II
MTTDPAQALLIRSGRDGQSFTAAALAVGGTVAALLANLYPNVMVSSTTPANNLTVAATASGDYALQVVTVVAAVMLPVVLLHQGWFYRVFRARLDTADGTSGAAPGAPEQ